MEGQTPSSVEPPSPSVLASGVPWTSGDMGRAVLMALLAILVLVGIGAAVIRSFGLRDQSLAVGLAISIVLQGVLLGAAWWFSVQKYHLPWSALGYRWQPGSQHLKTALSGILVALGIVLVYTLVLRLLHFEDRLPKQSFFEQDNVAFLAVGGILATVIAPVVEETFFRGFIFKGLLKGLGPLAAAAMSAGFFALAHISPWTYVPIFGIGLVLCWVYFKTGSILYSMLVHLGYNALAVFAGLATR